MRKNLGKGLGMGYKNLVCSDPKVHRQSRFGISQPQRMPQLLYNGTYGRKIDQPEAIIKALKRQKLKNLIITRNSINFDYMGRHIHYSIKYNSTVKNIANWGHSFTDNRVFIDEDVPDRYKPQLAVHEAVEQFASEKLGLKYPEAHQVAEYQEQRFAETKGIDWQTSQNAIFKTKV